MGLIPNQMIGCMKVYVAVFFLFDRRSYMSTKAISLLLCHCLLFIILFRFLFVFSVIFLRFFILNSKVLGT